MDVNNEPLRKCDKCKITKPKNYFIDINIVIDVILKIILVFIYKMHELLII